MSIAVGIVVIVLAVWATIATVAALVLGFRLIEAQRHARVAIRMAADAVEHRQEMERNTPVLVLAGHPTHEIDRVRYWLN